MTTTLERAVEGAAASSPAHRALSHYLTRQADAIVAGDLALRHGRDPIHDTRVALRRFRSTLRVFRKALDADAADRLEGELKWFAALLGEVRDCQVQGDRLAAALDDLPEALVLGPVKSDVRNHLASVERPARIRIAEAMDSERYLAMLADVRRWRTDPPFAPGRSAGDVSGLARRAARKADRRLARATHTDASVDDEALHSARKAAKRARYAAELLRPVQKSAKRTMKRFKGIQGVLGDHQDTVVATELLRRLGASLGAPADRNGFTYGLLFAREQRIATKCRKAARKLA